MTSNPTIFQKAIAETELYDEDVRRAAADEKDASARLRVARGRGRPRAADVFRSVYDETGGDDGFVSIEVGPHLANDTEGTIAGGGPPLGEVFARQRHGQDPRHGRRAFPPSGAASPSGININITLLFSVSRYREVMEAYLSALEERVAAGKPIDRLRSVASFFVSRVDTNVDKKLDADRRTDRGPRPSRQGGDRQRAARVRGFPGGLRIGSLRCASRRAAPRPAAALGLDVDEGSRAIRSSTTWRRSSRPTPSTRCRPRPSTPTATTATRRFGSPTTSRARSETFRRLAALGIDEPTVSRELEEEGVKKFSDSFDSLLKAIAEKEKAMRVA